MVFLFLFTFDKYLTIKPLAYGELWRRGYIQCYRHGIQFVLVLDPGI